MITIGETDYTLKAGIGAKDPSQAKHQDIGPGKHLITVKVPDKRSEQETVVIEAGSTWGVMILPNGAHFADRLY